MEDSGERVRRAVPAQRRGEGRRRAGRRDTLRERGDLEGEAHEAPTRRGLLTVVGRRPCHRGDLGHEVGRIEPAVGRHDAASGRGPAAAAGAPNRGGRMTAPPRARPLVLLVPPGTRHDRNRNIVEGERSAPSRSRRARTSRRHR